MNRREFIKLCGLIGAAFALPAIPIAKKDYTDFNVFYNDNEIACKEWTLTVNNGWAPISDNTTLYFTYPLPYTRARYEFTADGVDYLVTSAEIDFSSYGSVQLRLMG